MSSLLLSLCIPTYNRATLLSGALTAIVAQLDETTGPQVEVIISDNASPDETAAVVSDFISQYPQLNVRYHRQTENKGASANIYTTVKMARGDYVYILSDDDVLLPGAIARLLEVFKAHPHLDAVTPNIRMLGDDADDAGAPLFPVKEDLLIRDKDAALLFLHSFITFISILAFRREIVANKDYSDKVPTHFLQTYLFLDVLARDGGLLVTEQPCLAGRDQNSGGYNYFEAFVTHFNDTLQYAQSIGYSRQAVSKVALRHLKHLVGTIRIFKSHGSYGKLEPNYRDAARRLIRAYGWNPLVVFGVIPLMWLPRGFVTRLDRLYRQVKNSRSPQWRQASQRKA